MSGTAGDTSDIGMMYRQFLQSKGVPVTPDNMRRAVEQSRRDPNMLDGLRVQQDAPTPPNVAQANGSQRAVPQALPTPPMPPAAPPSPGGTAPTVSAPQPDVNTSPPTPPPGQAPGPQQASSGGPSIPDMLMSLFGGSAGAAPGIAALLQKIMGGAPTASGPPLQLPAPQVSSQGVGGRPPSPEGAPISMPAPDPATAPIGNIVTESAAPPPASSPPQMQPTSSQTRPSPEQMSARELAMRRGGMGGKIPRVRGVRVP